MNSHEYSIIIVYKKQRGDKDEKIIINRNGINAGSVFCGV
jgi:hypothetical protein